MPEPLVPPVQPSTIISLSGTSQIDLICFSHLRWNFVFQRPQHLLTRCAKERRVFYFEEPEFTETSQPQLRVERQGGITIATPQLPAGLEEAQVAALERQLLDRFMKSERIREYVLWYYTPMALTFTDHLTPLVTIYDCMDELSAFAHAPRALKTLELELMRRAALVFTGGHTLWEAKRDKHSSVHAFPSSVEVEHFAQARRLTTDPPDQAAIPKPRLGFFGVIDERMDLPLVDGIAHARPDWHIVMIGPIVKIDPSTLPRRPNIHYLGGKKYDELPRYVAGWDVALLPFARNEATRFISPTKTPEYLAAGKPVVSTSIRDVIRPYGQQGLARIADDVDAFVAACEAAMAENADERLRQADAFLRQTSWDGTWTRMRRLIDSALRARDATDAGGAAAAAGGLSAV